MGMDVYGLKPRKPEGEYFRASVWSWRPLIGFMKLSGADVPDDWHFNNGGGLQEDKDCLALAEKIRTYLEQCDESDFELPAPKHMHVNQDGFFVIGGTISPYRTDKERILRWCEFLENCGGFTIL